MTVPGRSANRRTVRTGLLVAAAVELVAAVAFAALALGVSDLRLLFGVTAVVFAVSAATLYAAAKRAERRLAPGVTSGVSGQEDARAWKAEPM